jgi:hypothetical protein
MKTAKSGFSFFNYKQTLSVVLMATVNADCKFITIDVGSMGRFSDGNIFPVVCWPKIKQTNFTISGSSITASF